MADKIDMAPGAFAEALFRQADGKVFVCALPNERGGHNEKFVATRDRSSIDGFVAKWDRPGSAIYICTGTLRPDARPDKQGGSIRLKKNVASIIAIIGDTDLKGVELGREEILAAYASLKCPPSVVVWSGRGAQAWWLLNEPVEATPETIEQIEALNRQIADVIGGDPVHDVCRLLRMPGSHNTKEGGWRPVEVVSARFEPRYELGDLEDWLSWQSPVIARKVVERGPRASQDALRNVFERVAADHGFRIPLDADARLAAMSYQGVGDSSIHNTQLAVSASMLTRGEAVEDVVDLLLEATKAAAGADGNNWNWTREERGIRKMCEDWQRKHPDVAVRTDSLKSDPRPKAQARQMDRGDSLVGDAEEEARGNGTTGATVHRIEDARRKKDKPAKAKSDDRTPVHVVLGEATLAAMQERGEAVIFTRKAAHFYRDGLWAMDTDGLKSWLDVQIEIACRALNIDGTNRVRAEARGYIQSNPDLWRDEIPWDEHGKIPTRSGLVDPATLQLEPARPGHYCTWRVEAEYDPAAACPLWETMVADTFADRHAQTQGEIVGTLQEVLGCALLDVKPRALSKALCLVGGSNYGKSGILEVFGGLFGDDPVTAGMESFETAHGLMPFVRRAPWVLHEAFDQRKWHFSSTVKAIITGEPVSINIKNGPILSRRIRAPIFWGTNHPPQFREATRAIVNRMIVIECRREFVEGQYIGVAVEARRRGLDRPSTLVLEAERPGLLNWAILGLKRALDRGSIDMNAEIRSNADEIHRDSNLSAGFIEECTEYDMDRRVSVPDFCAAFSVWFVENKGEDRTVPSNEAISKAVNALGNRRIASHPKETKDKHRRYFGGIILNELGRSYWKRAFEARMFEGKTASTTPVDGEVNSYIPDSWLERQTVTRMRVAHTGDSLGLGATVTAPGTTVTSVGTVTPKTVTAKLSPELSPGQLSPTQVTDPTRKPQF